MTWVWDFVEPCGLQIEVVKREREQNITKNKIKSVFVTFSSSGVCLFDIDVSLRKNRILPVKILICYEAKR